MFLRFAHSPTCFAAKLASASHISLIKEVALDERLFETFSVALGLMTSSSASTLSTSVSIFSIGKVTIGEFHSKSDRS